MEISLQNQNTLLEIQLNIPTLALALLLLLLCILVHFPPPVSENLFENTPQPFNCGSSQTQGHGEESTKKPAFLILGFEFQDVLSGGK